MIWDGPVRAWGRVGVPPSPLADAATAGEKAQAGQPGQQGGAYALQRLHRHGHRRARRRQAQVLREPAAKRGVDPPRVHPLGQGLVPRPVTRDVRMPGHLGDRALQRRVVEIVPAEVPAQVVEKGPEHRGRLGLRGFVSLTGV